MTTVIEPGIGNGCLFTQEGVGTSPGYDAIDLRRASTAGVQEGFVQSGAYAVVERADGANMSVDVNANAGIYKVQGDAVTDQGLYVIAPHESVINETISSNSSGDPRVDQVILEVLDNRHDASGSNIARVRVVEGTPTSGATLDNRLGAAALPSSAARLADILVEDSASSITTDDIRGRRTSSNGASSKNTKSGATTSGTALAAVSGFEPGFETPGNAIQATFSGQLSETGTAGACSIALAIDGVTEQARTFYPSDAGRGVPVTSVWTAELSAGYHNVEFHWAASSGGTLNLNNGTWLVREIVD